MSRARNYVFTINFGPLEDGSNYIEEPQLLDFSLFPSWISYCTYQLELSESGTEHFQGYLECVGTKSMIQLHAVPGFERAAMAVRRGTQAQADAYANKEDTRVDGPWTHGEKKEQG